MFAELIAPDDPRWPRVLSGTVHDVYHLPGYGSLYLQGGSDEERALYVRASNGELLLPLIVRNLPTLADAVLAGWRDASSPYGYSCMILRGEVLPCELDRLHDCVLDALCRDRILTCFVRGHPLLTTADPVLDRLGTAVVHGDTVHLRLERDEREIWSGMRPTLRRQIRRLKELGYVAERDEWSRLGDFKELYHDTMRRVGATPFYNFNATHFEGLRALLGDRLHLVTVLASNGKVVGGALNTACHGFVQGHLLGAETFEDIPSPALLLYDAEWRWAKQRGDRFFNLGGGRGGRNDSLFQFKKGFSNATAPFRTVRIVCEAGRYRRACAAAGIDGGDLSGFFPPYRSEPPEDKSPAAASTPCR